VVFNVLLGMRKVRFPAILGAWALSKFRIIMLDAMTLQRLVFGLLKI
jgi:hypothetical protein